MIFEDYEVQRGWINISREPGLHWPPSQVIDRRGFPKTSHISAPSIRRVLDVFSAPASSLNAFSSMGIETELA